MPVHSPARGALRVTGAILALLLTVGATSWATATMRVSDAETRIRAALDARGLHDVQFTMDGLDVRIDAASSPEALAEASSVIAGVEGTGRLTTAEQAVPVLPPASETQAPADPASTPSANEQPPAPTQPITFEPDSTVISEAGQAVVAEVALYLQTHQELRVQVIGHTAPLGDVETNASLSSDRAQAVADALIAHGIVPERIHAEGRGDLEPVSTDPADPGYHANRRVDFAYEAG